MLLQRKKESREASSRSLTRYGVPGGSAGRIGFDAEQEVRADEHRGHRHLDPGIEVVFGPRLAIERERPGEVGVGDRPAVGPPQQRTQDLFRRSLLVIDP